MTVSVSASFATLFELPCAMLPDEPLVTHGAGSLTYSEVRERSVRLAGALHELGIRPGAGVAIMSTNRPVWLEAFLATSRLGARLVGLNYRAKEDELGEMLRQGDVSVIIFEPRYLGLVRSAQARLDQPAVALISLEARSGEVEGYDNLIGAARPGAGAHRDHEPEPGRSALMLFTSGTTSAPKPVNITNDDVQTYLTTFSDLPDLTRPREVSLVSAPLYHIAGFFSMLTSVYGGREIVLLPQFERDAWLGAIAAHRVTHAFVVPTMLRQLLSHPEFESFDLSTLTRVSYGAAPMPMQVIEEALVRLPAVGFSNAYGQTETFGTVAVLGPEEHRLEGSPSEIDDKRRRLASVGRPIPGVVIKVCDEDGSELLPGAVGEVWVGRSSVSASEPAEPQRWKRTGDLGYLDEGGYLFLGARLNDLIIRGGENVAPGEIESVLLTHPGVEDVAVVGVPDDEWGEAILGYVVRREGVPVEEEELIEWVRERVASYKKPKAIHFIVAIPRNATGKTDRRELARLKDADPALQHAESRGDDDGPSRRS